MKIKIGHYDWNVELVDSTDKDLEDKYDGRCTYGTMRIAVKNDLDPQVIKETLLHELTHAYLCMAGRYRQTKFEVDELCEFVGWYAEPMLETADKILKEWKIKR